MIGQTFQPGTDNAYRRTLNQDNGQLGPSAQEALRVMSMRLPTVLSGRPITPDALLKPRVGGAAPGSALPTAPPTSGAPAQASVTGTGYNPYAGLMQIVNAVLGTSEGPVPTWTAAGAPPESNNLGTSSTPFSTASPSVMLRGANLAKLSPESRFASEAY